MAGSVVVGRCWLRFLRFSPDNIFPRIPIATCTTKRVYNVHSYATTFSPDSSAMLTDLIKAHSLIPTEPNVKFTDGGQQIAWLVDCAATLA
jgi:hypothetical protein